MKIFYRIKEETVEIVRCFGTDPRIVLPERIDGKPVTRASAYAFSARKELEEEDVLAFETEDHGIFRDGEKLLAGEDVESVCFPDTMEEIGNYIFYGCRNLKSLKFSNRLTGIGSGAFTGCRALQKLDVRMVQGSRSCVKEILGDLWQRIDVRFTSEDEAGERSEARLVFPEHYEEAVENTPARILFTQHHGSGNNYRQCFYDREMDYKKYDELFAVARVQDRVDVLSDMAFGRLMYPFGLSDAARRAYEGYIREHAEPVARYLTDTENMEALKEMSRRGLWQEAAMDAAIDYASVRGRREVLSILMEERHRLFPVRKKKYEL